MEQKTLSFLNKISQKSPKKSSNVSFEKHKSSHLAAIPLYCNKQLVFFIIAHFFKNHNTRNHSNAIKSKRRIIFDSIDISNTSANMNEFATLRSQRSKIPDSTRNAGRNHRINFSINNSIVAEKPISLHININNSILQQQQSSAQTIATVNLSKKFQSKILSKLQQNNTIDVIPTRPAERNLSNNPKQQSSARKSPTNINYNTNEEKFPINSQQALKRYKDYLNNFEKGEILDYNEIYFIGRARKKLESDFSDPKGYYHIIAKDQIAYRYEIMDYIGKGSFGQALKVFDHKEKQIVALKILRSKRKLFKQGMVEANILQFIKENDPENKSRIIKMFDHFIFRNHIMITFELLSINLFDFLRNNNFKGISLGLIRRFAIQLLDALCFLRKYQIIHCDLKPENVLLEQPTKSLIKLIDFGSSCFSNQRIYTYIQSRFYRAPEIMLGIPYTCGIDMWSFGCIMGELYTGEPIFPGENEPEQMSMICEINGVPPNKLLENATRREVFFDNKGSPFLIKNSHGRIRFPGGKNLSDLVKCPDKDFVEFLKGCFIWDPEKRMTPEVAKSHPWILKGNDLTAINSQNVNTNGTGKVNLQFIKEANAATKKVQDALNNTSEKLNLAAFKNMEDERKKSSEKTLINKASNRINESMSGRNMKQVLNSILNTSASNVIKTVKNEQMLTMSNRFNGISNKLKATISHEMERHNSKPQVKRNTFLNTIADNRGLPPIESANDEIMMNSTRSNKIIKRSTIYRK